MKLKKTTFAFLAMMIAGTAMAQNHDHRERERRDAREHRMEQHRDEHRDQRGADHAYQDGNHR